MDDNDALEELDDYSDLEDTLDEEEDIFEELMNKVREEFPDEADDPWILE